MERIIDTKIQKTLPTIVNRVSFMSVLLALFFLQLIDPYPVDLHGRGKPILSGILLQIG